MVAIKPAFLFALFGLAANVIATPPACLLAAVNDHDDPADMKVICGDSATNVQSTLASNCGSNADAAQKAFIASCGDANIKVASYSASSSASSSNTASGSSASATGSSATRTGSSGSTTTLANGASTQTGSSSSSTGSSSTNSAGKQLGSATAAILAVAGILVVL